MTTQTNNVMRLTPWVDEPTWGVLRSRVCAWLWARHKGMRVVLGSGSGAIFRRQARWLGLDWEERAPGQADLGDEALYLVRSLLAQGLAHKTQFWTGEIAWYGAALADVPPVRWQDAQAGEIEADPGLAWRLYAALLPNLDGGGPSDEFVALLADRDMGVSHVCVAAGERVASARYLAIAHRLDWEPPLFAHLPDIRDDRPVGLARLVKSGIAGGQVAIRAARLAGAGHVEAAPRSLSELVAEFDLHDLSGMPAQFDPSWQLGFNHRR